MTGSPLAIVGVDDRVSPGERVMAVVGRINEKIQKMNKIAYNPFFTLGAYPDIGHDHNRICTVGIKKTQMDILVRGDVVQQRIPVRVHSPFGPAAWPPVRVQTSAEAGMGVVS